jgi:DNA replication protein DnaC
MRAVDVLLIDDLGKEVEGSGYMVSALDRLLRDRSRERKSVIVTTNLPLFGDDATPSVTSRYRNSVADLLKEILYPFNVKGRGSSERRFL